MEQQFLFMLQVTSPVVEIFNSIITNLLKKVFSLNCGCAIACSESLVPKQGAFDFK